MKFERIGMRTIKTAFAVSMTIWISNIFKIRSPFFAGIAAIIAMQTSVSESLSIGKNRMFGTVLGAVVALLFSSFAPENIVSIGIGIVIIIYICNVFGWKKSIQLSAMVFLSIILNFQEGSRFNYALYRTLDTLIGLVIGTLINYFIVPPNVEGKINEMIEKTYSEFKKMIESIIYECKKPSLEELKKHLINMEESYNVLKKDMRLHLSKKQNTYDYNWIFTAFDNIYSNLKILLSMKKLPNINEVNREALKRVFNKEISYTNDGNLDELDLIYNYHLSELLKGLDSIDKALLKVEKLSQ
ncbi:FUSC family protein [Tepidimicrobium xylanilyticum]|uniref:Uncharacterized membrane protein YgaE, UPF0421/DUF939 family n=1 Tax=Tepidimicrobium xylanilyticum TaxID=1123352 RepID=A0A1H2QHJ6_9FIRM|nr:aromatic acid exporter family protein [Tepidimicrobium xylanilyticum]GMG95657.1 membrane protein [Tepidimicrobium xylanilyticum]SDW06575.1 Uncharacterized membrane protein YgaE, UPF0421/DUF939 family [Tepidimicrobium xylanilyticum]